MNINSDDVKRNAEKIIEKADRLAKLTKAEGWQDFIEVIDFLLAQEIRALAGQPLDHNYYKKIGFVQQIAFIRAIPDLIKDKNVREYLLHQGRAKAAETTKNLPFIYWKYKKTAQDQLSQILGAVSPDSNKNEFINESYKNS